MQEAPPLEMKSVSLLNRSLQVLLILASAAAAALCWHYAEIMLENSNHAVAEHRISRTGNDRDSYDRSSSADVLRIQRPGEPWLRLSSGLFFVSAASSGWLAWLAIRRSKRAFAWAKHLASSMTAASLALFAGSTWNLYEPVEPLILVILFWLIVSHGWNWKRFADTLSLD
jgi:hypothetical protein